MPDIVHRLRTSIVLLDAEREEAAAEIERLRKQAENAAYSTEEEINKRDSEIGRLRSDIVALQGMRQDAEAENERLWKLVVEAAGFCDYSDDEDGVGTRCCCQTLSYNPHEPDCEFGKEEAKGG